MQAISEVAFYTSLWIGVYLLIKNIKMLRIQLKLDADNTIYFASPFLPNAGLSISQCKDIELAKETVSNYVKTKTGQDVKFEEVKEISNFIFGIHH